MDALVKDGVRDVHVYINSPGGSCFDAAEIVNILESFKGGITGEGGAIVASAATFISLACKKFEMPENGMFMIHKPSGVACGTATDIENYLKLIAEIEAQYYDAYGAVAKSPDTLKEKRAAGDWWMTAREAAEQGFITAVRQKTKIDRETALAIKACGCPFEIKTEDYKPKNEDKMDVKATALLLGLPETATEAEVREKLEANKKAAADLEALTAAQAEKKKTEKEAKIKAVLDKAIVGRQITAEDRVWWEKMLNASFDAAQKAIESVVPVEKLTAAITVSPEGKKTWKGKTFVQLQDENPAMLADLEEENPEAFAELFKESYK